MSIKLNYFRKALLTLEQAFAEYQHHPQNTLMRDGIIQRFEYSYEIAWKLIKRYLEEEMGDTTVDTLNKKDLFRRAAVAGLIESPEAWFSYHENRNLTSHTYEENIAQKVFEAAHHFLKSALALLKELEKRLNQN